MPFSPEQHKKYKEQFVAVDVLKKTHKRVKAKAKKENKSLIKFVDDALTKAL